MSIIDTTRSKPKLWVSAGLLSAGLAGGLSLGASLPSGATDTSSTTTAATPRRAPARRVVLTLASAPYQGLPKSGTVTAVGTDSVTIDGTVYAVTSSSDIDKNGEATLSSLAVGDKVTFSTVASELPPTIDKLHAGNESLDRPTGGPSSSSGHGSSTGPTPPARHAAAERHAAARRAPPAEQARSPSGGAAPVAPSCPAWRAVAARSATGRRRGTSSRVVVAGRRRLSSYDG